MFEWNLFRLLEFSRRNLCVVFLVFFDFVDLCGKFFRFVLSFLGWFFNFISYVYLKNIGIK